MRARALRSIAEPAPQPERMNEKEAPDALSSAEEEEGPSSRSGTPPRAPPTPTLPDGVQQMQVVCPANATAGSTITVTTPSGSVTCTVPDGIGPGAAFFIQVPVARP